MTNNTPPLVAEHQYTRPADQRTFRYVYEAYPWSVRASIFEGTWCVFEGQLNMYQAGGQYTDEQLRTLARDWAEERIRSGEGFR